MTPSLFSSGYLIPSIKQQILVGVCHFPVDFSVETSILLNLQSTVQKCGNTDNVLYGEVATSLM